MIVHAPYRQRKLTTRVQPHEGAAVDAIAEQKGLSVSELLRAWITAGVKGDLPVEGYLVPQDQADREALEDEAREQLP